MSKIQELIKNMCPNGVEYKEIQEICTVTRGRVISKNELRDNPGNYPVYSSQTLNNGVFGKINSFDYDGEFVQWTTDGANAGSVFYRNGKFSVTNVCGLLKVKDEFKDIINLKFLSYILGNVSKQYVNYATSNPKLMSNVMAKIKVAAPPLPVQEEIVRILDKFGALEAALEAELEAELEARQSQYEFWRGKLLNSTKEIPKANLGDICQLVRGPFGGSLKKEIFVDDGYAVYEQQNAIYNKFTFRYFINEEKYKDMRRFQVQPNDIIMSCSGTMGKVAVIPESAPKGIINQALLKITPDESKINKYFLKYYFENTLSKILNNSAKGGAIKNVPSVGELKQMIVPLPSLNTQEKIVEILDKFDTICHDFEIALSAEKKLRQKQYEYYRDKLLMFAVKDD